jgi:hypothetical protein
MGYRHQTSVINDPRRIPVNKQALREFARAKELCTAPQEPDMAHCENQKLREEILKLRALNGKLSEQLGALRRKLQIAEKQSALLLSRREARR